MKKILDSLFSLELSQSEIARRLDVNQQSVNQWAVGRHAPSKKMLRKIIAMLNEERY